MKRSGNSAVSLVFALLTGGLFAAGGAPSASASPLAEGDSPRVVLRGNVHPLATPEFDIGPSDPDLPMERIILQLSRRPGSELSLRQLLADQQDPLSPQYHHWLTPEEFGELFGISRESIDRVVSWLQEQGFRVDEVARGRGWINFSGTAAQVSRAFRTPIHDYFVGGQLHHANAADPSLPADIAGLARGIVSLHSFHSRPLVSRRRPVAPEEPRPQFSSGGTNYMGPGDFAVIYHTNPLLASGTDGSGQTIAIVGRTDIKLADVQYFRSYFGLPDRDPVFIHNGPDPGDLGDDGSANGLSEENEADLDVEWAGAVAPQATVDFVISKTTTTSDGVDLSAQYIVDNNLAPIMSESFGDCESDLGTSGNSFENAIYQQAAAEGITVFVASSDSGAAGCDSPSSAMGHGLAVNGLCTTPYEVCVGGSMFDDASNPSAYWAGTSPPPGRVSALSYIPEKAWNESALTPGGSGLYAGGGGPSAVYPKPVWQSAPGVPADGKRDIPDVSLNAADHDGYLVAQRYTPGGNPWYVDSGTSASTPSFAALMALVVQHAGARQANAAATLYRLAQNQYGGSGPAVFHDITSGNNSVPGVTGYTCGAGYDMATGLGSVDAESLVNNWDSNPSGGTGPCVADSHTLCLNGSRFKVQVTWTDFQGNTGPGNVVSGVSSDSSGLFWFFSPTNWEMLIKVLNGCVVNGHYWVLGAASTNVQYTITVTDTQTGAVRIYTNPLGTSAPAITDTAAFAACP